MKTNIKKISSFLLTVVFTSFVYANDFIAIAKDGNVYDEANAKYITVNQENEDVKVIPGMVFLTSQHAPGWYKVEYSPGLHAFIPEQIVASNFNTIKPGSYEIKNNPGQKLIAEKENENWSAIVNGKTYKGIISEDIIVFVDSNNNIMFSLVDLGEGPVAITYDNSVTKFF